MPKNELFDAWFKRQVGQRPTSIRPVPLQQKIRELKEELARIESIRREAELWDEKYFTAKIAWETCGGKT